MSLQVSDLTPSASQGYINPDPRLPQHPARVLVVGESGSGKTNLVINILSKGWMHFDRVILVLKNPDQPSWEAFIDRIREVAEENDLGPVCTVVNDTAQIPSIESLDSNLQNIIIFDDFVAEKTENPAIVKYWVRSRHKNVSAFYLAQSFYLTPKTIRMNSTYYILYGGMPRRELDQLYRDVAPGLDKEAFIKLYEAATQERHSFFFIDKNNPVRKKRFRKEFDGIFSDL